MPGRDLLRLQKMFQVAAVTRYAELPIPADEDVLAEEFVKEWMCGGSNTPEAGNALDGLTRVVLTTFAIRAASRSVRDRNVEYVRLGIAAFCISGDTSDPRDLQYVMACLYDSSQRLGVEPALLFREAEPLARGGAARSLKEFSSLARGEFTLARYRVREGSDESGFRYRLGLAGAA